MKTKIQNNIPYKFTNESKGKEHILTISGAIGKSGWFYDSTSAEDVRNALNNVEADTIRIKLNSGGGDAFEGIEIYNYLKDLKARVIVEVTALSGSAASIITMGADHVIMRTGANMMIHEASTFAIGNKSDIQKTLNALESIDESIVDIYVQKTGLEAEEIREMLKNETWLTSHEALEKGFADEIESEAAPKEPEKATIDDEIINTIVQRITNELKTKQNEKEESTQVADQVTNKRNRFLF